MRAGAATGVRAAEVLAGCGMTLEGADAILVAGGIALTAVAGAEAGAGAGTGPFVAAGNALEVEGCVFGTVFDSLLLS